MSAKIAMASLVAAVLCCVVNVQAEEKPLSLIPQPQKVEQKNGQFKLNADTTIFFNKDSDDASHVAKLLAERLKKGTGCDLKVLPTDQKTPVADAILLNVQPPSDPAVGAEGYRLSVSPTGVVITAEDGAGLFYGVQTLLQLMPPAVFGELKTCSGDTPWPVPCVEIQDRPRFHWRGLMLDVSRHFFNKDEVKQYLDLMAQHKLNTFHWHLVDDQGWRIEIKKYPKLTEVGAWRKDIGFGLDPKAGTAFGPDGRYGGFYTQEDIREIVAYAKSLYITIVPEIEMPGHSSAALAAYPEFCCTQSKQDINVSGGIFHGVYCAGNDATYDFLDDVLTEVIDLFPDSKYIHVGGDEVPKDNWKKCPKCQARIKASHLKNEHELQSYFERRIEKFLNSKGKTLIGWDEILEGGLAPNATVMSWRGEAGGIAAANAGHDVVMTPTTYCYFDYYYAKDGKGEPKAIGGFLPLKTVYSYEPVSPKISADKAKHILGVGCNTWTEYMPNFRHVLYMDYPRACAACEIGWTDAKLKNWADFSRRLTTHLERLKAEGVNYRQPKPDDPK